MNMDFFCCIFNILSFLIIHCGHLPIPNQLFLKIHADIRQIKSVYFKKLEHKGWQKR